MLHQAAQRGRVLDAFVVRKQAKQHGMARQVEGPDISGKNVVILEDTSTTGASPLTAAEAAEAAGANVLAIATVVDRNTGAKEAIESKGYRYYSAISLGDLGLSNEV
jgi:orotate phosphoribosyltransferase